MEQTCDEQRVPDIAERRAAAAAAAERRAADARQAEAEAAAKALLRM